MEAGNGDIQVRHVSNSSINVTVDKRPKLREILRRPRAESEVMSEVPDLDFVYEDSDKHNVEIAELYSYTEEPEFTQNRKHFEQSVEEINTGGWLGMTHDERRTHIQRLLNLTDIADHDTRMHAVRALFYLVQGVFGEVLCEAEQLVWARRNVLLLYECGGMSTMTELLSMEIENGMACSAALRKPAVSLADSTDLRIILNIMYIMVETVRAGCEEEEPALVAARAALRSELTQPLLEEDCLAVLLFNMVTKFCSGGAPHFPMKKVLLLLWKVILLTLGGLSDLHAMKNAARAKAGLPPLTEDPHEVCKYMRAASPPASAADLIEQQQQPSRRMHMNRNLVKQGSLDDNYGQDELSAEMDNMSDDDLPPTPPRPSTPVPAKGLPWTPKVRQKDLENFLDNTRGKFVKIEVVNDTKSLAGLPAPIHEGVRVLKKHLYTSLTEVQITREEELDLSPLSHPEAGQDEAEDDDDESCVEKLYRGMLPNLPQYMIALLKILLAAAPTSKAKTDSINILADVLPEEMPTTVLQSMKLGIDVNRHKEIIVKAISALLLNLLKFLKLNHVYQFEYMSQHLVFANCIPLVLKFFNQNINSYVTAKNSISLIDFPTCVIGEQPELTAESLEAGDNMPYCWRNLFSCINLLRVLNKLTKWKHSRTMMLVVFKSAPILKRAMKVKQSMMQLYILKLLKMQTKYLGRQWRKSNMKTMSSIYQKVRHRLNDDWAYGNDMDARPWDFQAEECALRTCVDRFNNRRYGNTNQDPELEPVDNCALSVLGEDVELSDDFKQNYEQWLENEVFDMQIDWDRIITH